MYEDKYAPRTLDALVGRKEIVTPIKNSILNTGGIEHMLFHGPPGVGKTTLAFCIRNEMYGNNSQHLFFELNASKDNGIDVMRDKVGNWAKLALPCYDGVKRHRIIFLDEADNITPQAQASLRRIMEDTSSLTKFILSCNYPDKIIKELKSRCQCIAFPPLDEKLIANYLVWILKQENQKIDVTQVKLIAKLSNGDLRQSLKMLDGYVNGRTFHEAAGGSMLTQKFEAIRKLSYELDVRYLFRQLDQELGKLYEKGYDIRKAVLILSEYEYRASQATIGAIHFQSAFLKVKAALSEAKAK